MEIYLSKRVVRQIRLSISDAIDDGDTESLREDLIELFSEDQVEEIERRIDSGDIFDFVSEVLDEWSGEDVDELFELLEGQLSEADVDLKYDSPEVDEDEEEDEDEDGGEADDDLDFEEEDPLS